MKRGLRVLSVVLATVMLLSSTSLEIFAKENPYEQYVGKAAFTVSTSFSPTNGKAKIFVDVAKDSRIAAGLFKLSFDTSMLMATNIEIGTALKNGSFSTNIGEDGSVMVSYAHVNPLYEEGRIFEVDLQVIGNIPDQETFINVPINLTVEDLRNYEDYKIQPVVINGKVTVIDTPYGDVNESGSITAVDALMVLNANVNLLELTERQKVIADVNGDGILSATDALLILRSSAGDISNFPIFTATSPASVNLVDKGETSLTVSWDKVQNAVGYNVYDNGEKVNEEIITELSYTIDNLEQNTRHAVTVSTVNVLYETEQSMPLNTSTDKAERTVIFKDYDGRILDSQIVLSSEAAVLPEEPHRKGYTFIGYDGDTTCILEDTIFTALYEINTYKVTYDYLYGDEIREENVVFGECAKGTELIEREDYTLEGWYFDKNFTKRWDFDTDIVEDDIVLYANWVTWSEWSTDASLKDNPLYEVESKTQYSYRDKSTKTSGETSLSGWTRDTSVATIWSAWSDPSRTPVSATESRQVDSKIVDDSYNEYKYVYFHYCDGKGSASNVAMNGRTRHEYYRYSLDLPQTGKNSGGVSYYGDGYACECGSKIWYKGLAGNGNAATEYRAFLVTASHTEWCYRTATFTYYKWSAYSDWVDEAITATSTRQVKTQTVYRYKLIQQ